MKWEQRFVAPQVGDTRRRDVFAWWPTPLTDGYVVWLETYRAHQLFGPSDLWETIRTESLFFTRDVLASPLAPGCASAVYVSGLWGLDAANPLAVRRARSLAV